MGRIGKGGVWRDRMKDGRNGLPKIGPAPNVHKVEQLVIFPRRSEIMAIFGYK